MSLGLAAGRPADGSTWAIATPLTFLLIRPAVKRGTVMVGPIDQTRDPRRLFGLANVGPALEQGRG